MSLHNQTDKKGDKRHAGGQLVSCKQGWHQDVGVGGGNVKTGKICYLLKTAEHYFSHLIQITWISKFSEYAYPFWSSTLTVKCI